MNRRDEYRYVWAQERGDPVTHQVSLAAMLGHEGIVFTYAACGARLRRRRSDPGKFVPPRLNYSLDRRCERCEEAWRDETRLMIILSRAEAERELALHALGDEGVQP